MSVNFGDIFSNLYEHLSNVKSMHQLNQIKQQGDLIVQDFASGDKQLSDDQFLEYLNFSDKLAVFEKNFHASQLGLKDPIIVFHQSITNSDDRIRVLTTFKTVEEWKEQLANTGFSSDIPCYFARVSEIWEKISQERRNKIDEQIYKTWSVTTCSETNVPNKGQLLREEKGFADKLIRDSLIAFCLKNGITLKKTFQAEHELERIPVNKVAEILSCPIKSGVAEDLSIIVPCGHNISEAIVAKLPSSLCPSCKTPFTQVIPNRAVREFAQLFKKHLDMN